MGKTVIQVSGLHKHYGPRVIFEGAECAIADDHRLGVIGRNGAGKSTLCRMILGTETPDAGKIHLHNDLRLGYLEQQDPFLPGETAVAFLERRSGKPAWKCGEVAGRFLLGPKELNAPVAGLSGGFQTRVRLTAMLLAEPTFLILDEPTNYLDLKTVLLLERFLLSFRGGWMIVSHDREFLKRTCKQTLAVDHGRIDFYPGNVEAWLGYREEQRAQAEAVNANVMAKRKQLEEFVARFKAKASKATQAASKQKQLDRLETIAIDHASADVTIRMPKVESRSGVALRLDDVAIGYPERTIADGITVEVERGSHVAILGDNGQGKTTLLRTLSGSLPPKEGLLKWGHAIRVGTYAQHVFASMDAKLTVRQYLERAHLETGAAGLPNQEIMDMAGAFLFRGDDVDKKIGVLSGGERSRLCLAGLLLGRFPVLLLDEPTNHLDFETTEALAAALQDYDGTLLFTCHDRTFVAGVATDIIEVKDGQARRFGDGYDAYVWRLEREAAEAEPAGGKAGADGKDQKSERRDRQDRIDKAKKRLKKVEQQVATLDAEKRKLTEQLNVTYEHKAGERLAQVTAELETAETEWMALTEELETLGANA
jgi:ATP-binding cassette subfamily F protein 3